MSTRSMRGSFATNSETKQFRAILDPLAKEEAMVKGKNVRITVLTPQLLRLEYSPVNQFEDRASQTFWFRRQPVPEYHVVRSKDTLEIITDALHLIYHENEIGFNPQTLQIKLLNSEVIWKYEKNNRLYNLMGTARTLDDVNGSAPLDFGLLSKAGWATVDDSRTTVFDEDGWVSARFDCNEGELADSTKDIYFFGYGKDYKKCLSDFCRLSGKTPLFPRWALGNWWSRYWAYSQKELTDLMQEFRHREIPLSVCVIDMDWHVVKNDYTNGWTGYTWNKSLFPDSEELIETLHKEGLKIALNLHPADGIAPHEEMYEEMANHMGVDPKDEKVIPFDLVDPHFADGYFKILHHPHEKTGIDFWWLDWQQGMATKINNLDPLRWLNHLHFLDLGRNTDKRPFIFSRYAGLGSHRYPIGFSGDTHITWDSLAFQPYFTATAANVAYGWWSHDIGGHMKGIEEPELYARWVQYGVFSPILRLHSTKSIFNERRPWAFYGDIYAIAKNALKLRHSLIPYIYSMLWRDSVDCIPLCTPMYYDFPNDEKAYKCKDQYNFGSELIAAPYIKPIDPEIGLSRQTIWLPEGHWFDFFSGEYFKGGRIYSIYGDLTDIPVFAKGGAMIPMDCGCEYEGVHNPTALKIKIFPGSSNVFRLYEDDGETNAYKQGHFCITELVQKWDAENISFSIRPASGDQRILPEKRTFLLEFFGMEKECSVKIKINGEETGMDSSYNKETESLSISEIILSKSDSVEIILSGQFTISREKKDRILANFKLLLSTMRMESFRKRDLYKMLVNGESAESILDSCMDLNPIHLTAISEVLQQ